MKLTRPRQFLGLALLVCGGLAGAYFLLRPTPPELAQLESVYRDQFENEGRLATAGCFLVAALGAGLAFAKYEGTGLPPAQQARVNRRFGSVMLVLGGVMFVAPFLGVVVGPRGADPAVTGRVPPWFLQLLGAGLAAVGGVVLALARGDATKAADED